MYVCENINFWRQQGHIFDYMYIFGRSLLTPLGSYQIVPIIEASLVRRLVQSMTILQATPLNQWHLPSSLKLPRQQKGRLKRGLTEREISISSVLMLYIYCLHEDPYGTNSLALVILLRGVALTVLTYSGKFSHGANFCIFRMRTLHAKMKTTKIWTIENFA